MLKPRIWGACPRWRPSPAFRLTRPYATEASVEPAVTAVPASIFSQGFEAAPPIVQANAVNMRTYKPRTPGLRHLKRPINDHLWKGRAYLPLTIPRKGHGIGGRNSTGLVTMRHRGGGHKRRIRIVDFARQAPGKHLVERIEHDPGRGAHIALVSNTQTGEKSYILAAEGLRADDVIESFMQGIPDDLIQALGGVEDAAMLAAKTAWRGNCLPLKMVPPGTMVFNVGLKPRRGGQLCRGAGTFATVLGVSSDQNPKYGKYINVRLRSGEVRRIHKEACATVGVASNGNHGRQQLGKAGRSRWLGIRPTVRGVAMNASDHPHGGGRGKSKGNRIPVSIWGRTPVSFKGLWHHNINPLITI